MVVSEHSLVYLDIHHTFPVFLGNQAKSISANLEGFDEVVFSLFGEQPIHDLCVKKNEPNKTQENIDAKGHNGNNDPGKVASEVVNSKFGNIHNNLQ